MKAPCSKTCPDRRVGCHGECVDYIEYDNFRKQVRKKRLAGHEAYRDTYQSKKRNLELRKKLDRM